MTFTYESTETPPGYECVECRASGCKLWRLYNTFLDHQKLYCCECAGKREGRDVSAIDERGRTMSPLVPMSHDSIGGLIPAVPTEENDTFWGYTSVPQPGVEWWFRLPSKPPRATK